MKVILSVGLGRLHLIQSASYLAQRGCSIQLIMGWVPKNLNGWSIKIYSKLAGRNLEAGMLKRQITNPILVVKSCSNIDFLSSFLWIITLKSRRYWAMVATFCFKCFGRCSRKYIKNADIFHVRSGAGQGGAIAQAKVLGMKVLVDHSIAHPRFMEEHLRSEYERHGKRFGLGVSSPFWKLVLKDCQEADILLVNSFFVRDTFVSTGYAPEKIRVAYQGTRADFFGLRKKQETPLVQLKSKQIKLLFTGSFGFRKGGEYLLDALKTLKINEEIDFIMDVVGVHEPMRQIIQRYAQDGLPIHFHGPVPQDDLKDYLSNADIYVFPSLAEGCASSGMEAMAAGLCVVATYESGLPITDGETGYIVPSKDAKAIAERIVWLARNPEEVNRVGVNAARLIATEYTWEKYAENVEGIYLELTQTKGES